mgnify:CR=1 FL=1
MTQGKPRDTVNEVELAIAVDLDNGEQQDLSVREGSRCHFFEPIEVSGHRVILRLDWTDIDDKGRPTLDADFYDSGTGKKLRNSGDRRAAHHTQASRSTAREYEWIFRTEKLRLRVSIHFTMDFSEALQLSDSITIDVYRNGRKVDYE